MVKSDLRHKNMDEYEAAVIYFGLIQDGLRGSQALDLSAYLTGYDREALKCHVYGEVSGMDDPDVKYV